MSAHTPGPWHKAGDSDGTMVTDDNGAQIAMWPPQGGTVEQCANARLIAAAPDLLDALQRVMRHIPDNAGGASLSDDMHRAKKAIARATGA